jgi:hypothetical protein
LRFSAFAGFNIRIRDDAWPHECKKKNCLACSSASSIRRSQPLGKPEGKRLIGRPSHRWVDNIKITLKELRWRMGVWAGFILLRIKASSE